MTEGIYVSLDPYQGWQVIAVDGYGNKQPIGRVWETMEEALREAALQLGGRPFGLKLVPMEQP